MATSELSESCRFDQPGCHRRDFKSLRLRRKTPGQPGVFSLVRRAGFAGHLPRFGPPGVPWGTAGGHLERVPAVVHLGGMLALARDCAEFVLPTTTGYTTSPQVVPFRRRGRQANLRSYETPPPGDPTCGSCGRTARVSRDVVDDSHR